jgi:SAM-dependent methyltransferase
MNSQCEVPHFQDYSYLRHDQYKTPGNLNARAQLHHRYSTNKTGWYNWLFSFLAIDGRTRILDCGCGPGGLWRETLTSVLGDCQVVLADLSEGMVREARNALARHRPFKGFQVADIAALPFADKTFDVVIANHMLYHVFHRQKALQEVSRVLRAGGQLVAATNGADHLQELWALEQLIARDQNVDSNQIAADFSLENGAAQLRAVFSDVESFRYPNNLQVTNADDILAYLLSSSEIKAASIPEKVEELRRTLAQKIATDGAYSITSHSGVFLARKES